MSGASLVRTLVGMERAHPATDAPPGGRGRRGILAPATRLDRWLDIVLVGLVLTSALRYAGRHDLDVKGLLVLGGAALFVAVVPRPAAPARPVLVADALGGRSWSWCGWP